MKTYTRPVIALILSAFLAPLSMSQQRMIVDVNLASVTVDVRSDGRPVLNLGPGDFEIFENGQSRPIGNVTMETVPVALVLLVDRSISIEPVRKRLDEAATFLLDAVEPSDRTSLMTFAGKNSFDVPMAGGRDDILKAMRKVKLGYGTHLYDAVVDAMQYLAKTDARRKVLVILSDGADHDSINSFNATLDLARSLDLQINVIGYLGEDPITWSESGRQEIRRQFEQLATTTHGKSFFPKSSAECDHAATQILRDARYDYRLDFYSAERSSDRSNVEVRLLGDRLQNADVRIEPTRRLVVTDERQ